MRRRILNSILNLTGSRCSEANTGETWSLFLVLVRTRAGAFWISWSPALFSHRILLNFYRLYTRRPGRESSQKLLSLSFGQLCSHMHVLQENRDYLRSSVHVWKQLYLTNSLKKSCPPVSFLMGKITPHSFFAPSLPSSPPFPSSPIKNREPRGHNGGEADLFDPHAVLSSVFSIQPVQTGIIGVDRLSAQRDKSPLANCSHIKWRRTSHIGALRLM